MDARIDVLAALILTGLDLEGAKEARIMADQWDAHTKAMIEDTTALLCRNEAA